MATLNKTKLGTMVKAHVNAQGVIFTANMFKFTSMAMGLMNNYLQFASSGGAMAMGYNNALIVLFKSPLSGADRWTRNGKPHLLSGNLSPLVDLITSALNEKYPFKVSIQTDVQDKDHDGDTGDIVVVTPNTNTDDDTDAIITPGDPDPPADQPQVKPGQQLIMIFSDWINANTPQSVKNSMLMPGLTWKGARMAMSSAMSSKIMLGRPQTYTECLDIVKNYTFKFANVDLGKSIPGLSGKIATVAWNYIKDIPGFISGVGPNTGDDDYIPPYVPPPVLDSTPHGSQGGPQDGSGPNGNGTGGNGGSICDGLGLPSLGFDGFQGSGMFSNMGASIMKMVKTIVIIGIVGAVIGLLGYLGYLYFIEPKMHAKKMKQQREQMKMQREAMQYTLSMQKQSNSSVELAQASNIAGTMQQAPENQQMQGMPRAMEVKLQ